MSIRQYFKPRDGLLDPRFNVKNISGQNVCSIALLTKMNFFEKKISRFTVYIFSNFSKFNRYYGNIPFQYVPH